MICIMIRDHGIYDGSGYFFMILVPLLQPEVAKIVAKRPWFLQLCNSRVTKSRVHIRTKKRFYNHLSIGARVEVSFHMLHEWLYSEERILIVSSTNNVLLSYVVADVKVVSHSVVYVVLCL